MGLEIKMVASGTGEVFTMGAKLWLTADKDEVVADGDPRAAFLFCTPGSEISRADAERLGLVGGGSAAKRSTPVDNGELAAARARIVELHEAGASLLGERDEALEKVEALQDEVKTLREQLDAAQQPAAGADGNGPTAEAEAKEQKPAANKARTAPTK